MDYEELLSEFILEVENPSSLTAGVRWALQDFTDCLTKKAAQQNLQATAFGVDYAAPGAKDRTFVNGKEVKDVGA